MGVASAAVFNNTILLTEIAGQMAGAIAMAVGGWLSVQSSGIKPTPNGLRNGRVRSIPKRRKRGIGFIVLG
ncbi:VIT1/CCC1 transporter family protein [Flavobacterium sp. ACAM 123]|jgi:hypothetical protein|uniref:VIT1/CCC1 transporter family protein n=1 Tax=Flavobacterium sp. ACAM 123 TaxID=1189620 RepID=UPI0002FCB837|nr:VIT1/CCC1 transporter family protein [Flavobacterium sp. ACAM 123]